MSNTDAISRIHAREVLDSRGNPTVEVEVHCQGGAWGRTIVPSGASTGKHEALEIRDGDPKRHKGKGVRRAVTNVRDLISPHLLGHQVTDQQTIDRKMRELDGTANKSRLGANAILGVSLAGAHAGAAFHNLPLWRYLECLVRTNGLPPSEKPRRQEVQARMLVPTMPLPMVNMISGGLHAGGNLEFQDFLLLPIGARSYSESLEMAGNVYRSLSEVLCRHGFEGVLVGDEGGFGPRLQSNEQAVEIVIEAIEQAGYAPGQDAALAIDVASSHFYCDGHYHLKNYSPLSSDAMIALLERWVKNYPILSIEDGLAEDDWTGWRALTDALGNHVQLIGDDFFATNPERLARGVKEKAANSVLVKVNQIGTLTETLEVIALARSAGYRSIISARSGETEDATIADLAVATGAGQIKIGSVARSERLAKYNQLLRIEENGEIPFAGWKAINKI